MTTADTLTAPAAPAAPTTLAHTPRRGLTRTLRVVRTVLAVFFMAVALPKLAGQHTAVESFAKIGLGQWLRYAAGSCELAGGIALLIPRLRGLAATALVGQMIGATAANLAVAPATAPFTVALGAVFTWIAWQYREETKTLARTIKR